MSKSTLATDLAVTLKIVKAEQKTLRIKAAQVSAALKVAKADVKAEKAAATKAKKNVAAEKKAASIAKLEAKLIAMKAATVGSKAIKMNKKPSACTTVYQMAA